MAEISKLSHFLCVVQPAKTKTSSFHSKFSTSKSLAMFTKDVKQ